MSVREEFDRWAAEGRDRGMEERHWATARQGLARIPVEPDDVVVDLGCGSGYAGRALREATEVGRVYGIDGAPEMAANADGYTDDPAVGFVIGDFGSLPFPMDRIDHVWSMEAFYYAADPHQALAEIRRVLRPGGTFHCAVNYYEENVHAHDWASKVSVPMTRWSARAYREAFREAGFAVAVQDNVPDRDVGIPPADAFPTDDWESREAMVERYRELGTLLTIGVAPS